VNGRVWWIRWPLVMVEPAATLAPPSRSAAGIRQTRPNLATATKETTMRAAFHYYLTQARTADRYPQAQRDAPARAASRASYSRPSPRAPRASGFPAVVARRLRSVLGGSP
jgi:hypothetical protein